MGLTMYHDEAPELSPVLTAHEIKHMSDVLDSRGFLVFIVNDDTVDKALSDGHNSKK